ncbi:MAG: hypothetical protein HC880_10595 [Bacteroidia bacterium]|nr:hypothetical protein [Bacteroidia bacterium]
MNQCFSAILLFLFLTFTSTSCLSVKKRFYVQNENFSAQQVTALANEKPSYRIQTNDVISVQVASSGEGAAEIINPVETGNNFIAQGNAALYLRGYVVDGEGNIYLPTIGQVSVVGKTLVETRRFIQTKVENY